jgi:amino acid permease
VILDSIALYTIVDEHVIINEHYVNALPYYVTAIDSVGVLFWMGCWIVSLCSYCCDKGKEYKCLALSTLGPVPSLVVHLPYVAIAYLNDASYATSIFIFYTITVFVVFGTLDLTYGTCQGAIINAKLGDRDGRGCYHCCLKSEENRRRSFIIIIPLSTLVILVFAGMITAALVIIPISKAFSDVPNRLLGFYQTVIILIGAYLVYRNFFKKKPTLDFVVKERKQMIQTDTVDSDEKWNQLSKDERVEQFYTRFIDIIANYPIEKRVDATGNPPADDAGDQQPLLQQQEA